MSEQSEKKEIVLQGVAASPGVSHGPAFVFLQKELEIPLYDIEENQVESEIQRFEQTLIDTRSQISKLRSEVAEKLGEDEAQIFDAHLLVLEDNALIEESIRAVREESHNIEYSFHKVSRRFIEAFDSLEDGYIKERAADIRDVTKRVLHNLMGESGGFHITFDGQRILVSEDLAPSDTASLDQSRLLGFITDAGSRTSHSVIMARSLGVPAVVGLHDVTKRITSTDYVLVDGYDGVVVINPTEHTLFRYGQLKEEKQSIQRIFESTISLVSETADRVPIKLMANIGGVQDCEQGLKNGAKGVGLYRTESLFLQKDEFPDEETQYEAYRDAAIAMKPHSTIIRTLDIGGDKQSPSFAMYQDEINPFMGFRAIRFCLEHKDVFTVQLRAILRASAHGRVKIMYPMICSVSELVEANELLEEVKATLRAEGQHFDENIEVGSMIEIPSAAMVADLLAEHCDFFSIGTNDLIQYLLAVDRVNDRIAHLYEPSHPAVIRTLDRVIQSAREQKVPVGVCGEMAGDPLYVPLLLGLGADSLSVSATSLPEIKYLVRKMTLASAKKMAQEVLKQKTPEAIFNILESFYMEQLGDVLGQDKKPEA